MSADFRGRGVKFPKAPKAPKASGTPAPAGAPARGPFGLSRDTLILGGIGLAGVLVFLFKAGQPTPQYSTAPVGSLDQGATPGAINGGVIGGSTTGPDPVGAPSTLPAPVVGAHPAGAPGPGAIPPRPIAPGIVRGAPAPAPKPAPAPIVRAPVVRAPVAPIADRQTGGAFGPGSAAFAMAHGPITGSTLIGRPAPSPAPVPVALRGAGIQQRPPALSGVSFTQPGAAPKPAAAKPAPKPAPAPVPAAMRGTGIQHRPAALSPIPSSIHRPLAPASRPAAPRPRPS